MQPEWQEEVHEEKIDLGLWRQILRLARPYRRYIALSICSTVALAAGDAAFPYMTKVALDRFVIPQTTEGLGWFGAAFLGDRKSTRLNSSHVRISYAVFCL